MNWIEALKHWNEKKGGEWVIPKKGTKEHAQVMKLVKKKENKTVRKKENKTIEKRKVGRPKKKSDMENMEGGSLKSKSEVIIIGEPQHTEKALRMKGGAMKKRKELQVISGQPQVTYVRGGYINSSGSRSGMSDPKLYGLKMFGE